MKRKLAVSCFLFMVSVLCGCADVAEPKTQPQDKVTVVPGIMQTAGGGTISSPSHKGKIFIGAPSPMGKVESSTHVVKLGPGSVVPPAE